MEGHVPGFEYTFLWHLRLDSAERDFCEPYFSVWWCLRCRAQDNLRNFVCLVCKWRSTSIFRGRSMPELRALAQISIIIMRSYIGTNDKAYKIVWTCFSCSIQFALQLRTHRNDLSGTLATRMTLSGWYCTANFLNACLISVCEASLLMPKTAYGSLIGLPTTNDSKHRILTACRSLECMSS